MEGGETDSEWLGVSDLMAVLMMVFLFLAVLFLIKVEHDKNTFVEEQRNKTTIFELENEVLVEQQRHVVDIAQVYYDHKIDLHEALFIEFGKDLEKWGLEIYEDHTLRFTSPKVKFAYGGSKVQQSLAFVLDDFFPRYVRLLKRYSLFIDEVRIEAHTYAKSEVARSGEEQSLSNINLSYQRSLEVWKYCFGLISGNVESLRWLENTVRANGVPFSVIKVDEGFEIPDPPIRLEFKINTRSRESIEQIIDAINIARTNKSTI